MYSMGLSRIGLKGVNKVSKKFQLDFSKAEMYLSTRTKLICTNPKPRPLKGKTVESIGEFITGPKYPEAIKILTHCIIGSIKGKRLQGIHLFWPRQQREIELSNISNPDNLGVFKATVTHIPTGYLKDSTFFPKLWTPTHLLFECFYAVNYRRNPIYNKEHQETSFDSKTLSGVPVKLYYNDNDQIKTIIPLKKE